MIAKTSECKACPAYQASPYWVPDKYVAGSQVLVLQGEVSEYDVKGQHVTGRTGFGKYSIEQGSPGPLIGPDGYDLKNSFYGLGRMQHTEVSVGSSVRCQAGLTGKAQQEAAAYCQATHFHPPQSIELVIALGPMAAQAMGLEGKMEQWRGHVLES